MPETTPLIKAALNLRVGVGFDVYHRSLTKSGHVWLQVGQVVHLTPQRMILPQALTFLQ